MKSGPRTPRPIPLAMAVASIVLVAGCGRPADVGDQRSASTTVDTKPATGKIQVWAFANEGTALEGIATDFEAENPGTDVVITPVPNEELPRKVDTAVATGNVPDIVQPSTALPTLVATGGLASVPEGVMDDAQFFPGAVEAGTVNGTRYAVPWYVTVQALFYRTDLAKAADVKPPKTWNDLRGFADALKSEGVDVGYAAPFTPENSWQLLLPLIYQEGGSVLDAGAFTFDTPAVIAAFTTYQKLFTSGVATTGYAPTQPGEAETDVVKGDVGATTSGSFFYGYLRQTAKANKTNPDLIGIAELPAGSKNNDSYLGGSGLSVFKEAPNPAGAWKFIRYLTQPKVQATFYEAAGVLPAGTAAWRNEPLSTNPVLATFREALQSARATPAFVTWTEIRKAMSEYGEQLARGKITPEQAAEQLQRRATTIGTG
ncbi:multiple sugar transport system substrate-binding protein [Nonomuraea solani]|uniref:Multiple sugar transport system substrate-binding protein n=1 Tax=Nonomuraea solani TaxID=1144553 RepID=A0A1H6EYZ4_9ACTN|nr:extracellular solute-binding protein [Nonomuraea solani]SEH02196.1 multiple sugar transport system substrate-binding protein [Nonomuraea solani]